MSEEWRPVVGYEGIYSVSSLGRIRRDSTGRILRQPHAGKGENSWDCGDDGIYGIGSDSHSLPKAIGHAVAATLERRERYGNASWLRA